METKTKAERLQLSANADGLAAEYDTAASDTGSATTGRWAS